MGTDAHEILDNWRWRSDQRLYRSLPVSSPFLVESRFSISRDLDAAFLVARKLGTQLVVKVNFMIQNAADSTVKHAATI